MHNVVEVSGAGIAGPAVEAGLVAVTWSLLHDRRWDLAEDMWYREMCTIPDTP